MCFSTGAQAAALRRGELVQLQAVTGEVPAPAGQARTVTRSADTAERNLITTADTGSALIAEILFNSVPELSPGRLIISDEILYTFF